MKTINQKTLLGTDITVYVKITNLKSTGSAKIKLFFSTARAKSLTDLKKNILILFTKAKRRQAIADAENSAFPGIDMMSASELEAKMTHEIIHLHSPNKITIETVESENETLFEGGKPTQAGLAYLDGFAGAIFKGLSPQEKAKREDEKEERKEKRAYVKWAKAKQAKQAITHKRVRELHVFHSPARSEGMMTVIFCSGRQVTNMKDPYLDMYEKKVSPKSSPDWDEVNCKNCKAHWRSLHPNNKLVPFKVAA